MNEYLQNSIALEHFFYSLLKENLRNTKQSTLCARMLWTGDATRAPKPHLSVTGPLQLAIVHVEKIIGVF